MIAPRIRRSQSGRPRRQYGGSTRRSVPNRIGLDVRNTVAALRKIRRVAMGVEINSIDFQ
jgi:hypothetical protein